MSCEDKHNNQDCKYCTECGLKLYHDTDLVSDMNKKLAIYKKTAEEFGFPFDTVAMFKKFDKDFVIKNMIYYIDDKFYTQQQTRDLYGDLPILAMTGIFHIYGTISTPIDNSLQESKNYARNNYFANKRSKLISDIGNEFKLDYTNKGYLEQIANSIKYLNMVPNLDGEKLKIELRKLLDFA